MGRTVFLLGSQINTSAEFRARSSKATGRFIRGPGELLCSAPSLRRGGLRSASSPSLASTIEAFHKPPQTTGRTHSGLSIIVRMVTSIYRFAKFVGCKLPYIFSDIVTGCAWQRTRASEESTNHISRVYYSAVSQPKKGRQSRHSAVYGESTLTPRTDLVG